MATQQKPDFKLVQAYKKRKVENCKKIKSKKGAKVNPLPQGKHNELYIQHVVKQNVDMTYIKNTNEKK